MVLIDIDKPKKTCIDCPLLGVEDDCKMQDEKDFYSWAEQMNNCPLVEVIRCKDCKHRDEYGCCKKLRAFDCRFAATDDDDFCNHGERKRHD